MNYFSDKSQQELDTAMPDLEGVAELVLQIKDHSILKGHRNQPEQDAAFYAMPQRTTLKWPEGKHNTLPSMAIDVRTYPLPKGETEEEEEAMLREDQLYLLGLYVGVGAAMGVKLRTGADWDKDGEIADNGFDDLFHVEIAGA